MRLKYRLARQLPCWRFLLVIVAAASTWLMISQPAAQREFHEVAEKYVQNMVKRGFVAEAASASSIHTAELQISLMAVIGPVAVALISPFWWGFLIWLVGAKILKRGFSFMKAVEVAGLANAILILYTIIRVLLLVGFHNPLSSPGLALMLKEPDPHNPMFSLLGVVDFMVFWTLAVRALGLAKLARHPFFTRRGVGLWTLGVAGIAGNHCGDGDAGPFYLKKTRPTAKP